LLAGALGIGVHHIATQFGAKGEPIVLGIFVFVMGKKNFHVTFFECTIKFSCEHY